jgi:hypothetical protein
MKNDLSMICNGAIIGAALTVIPLSHAFNVATKPMTVESQAHMYGANMLPVRKAVGRQKNELLAKCDAYIKNGE